MVQYVIYSKILLYKSCLIEIKEWISIYSIMMQHNTGMEQHIFL